MTPQEISQLIFIEIDTLVEKIGKRHQDLSPALYSQVGWRKYFQDTHYNLSYLGEAIALANPMLFANYINWLGFVLKNRNVSLDDVIVHFEICREILFERFPQQADQKILDPFISAGIAILSEESVWALDSFIKKDAPYADLAQKYLKTLLSADRQQSSFLITNAVKDGIPIKNIYLHIFQPVQWEIGRLWQLNEINVAQEHYATAVTQLVMSQLYPYIFDVNKNGHSLIATCVGGELHEVGIRMVADFFEMAGWDTFYLGANMQTQGIIDSILERRVQVLAISATLLIHIKHVKRMITAIRNSSAADVKILIGGYVFNVDPTLWQKVGADGYAQDAESAIQKAGELVGGE